MLVRYVPTYQERVEARAAFESIPDVQDFLAAEAGGVGEPEQTWRDVVD